MSQIRRGLSEGDEMKILTPSGESRALRRVRTKGIRLTRSMLKTGLRHVLDPNSRDVAPGLGRQQVVTSDYA